MIGDKNMSIKKLDNTIKEMLDNVKKIKIEINKKILQLPDNPNITRLGTNCFTINHKDLSKDLILSPFYN